MLQHIVLLFVRFVPFVFGQQDGVFPGLGPLLGDLGGEAAWGAGAQIHWYCTQRADVDSRQELATPATTGDRVWIGGW